MEYEKTERHKELEGVQRKLIEEIRSHLSEQENECATDRLIWQRAVKFGPNSPTGHAQKLKTALANAEQHGKDLEAELSS